LKAPIRASYTVLFVALLLFSSFQEELPEEVEGRVEEDNTSEGEVTKGEN
jgi:hypothetical protein